MARKSTVGHEKRKAKAQKAFLEALAEGLTIVAAVKASGFARSSVYDWRRQDKEFANSWQSNAEIGFAVLEDAAHERAVNGVAEPTFHQGKVCGAVQRYSDTLLIMLLKARDPLRYCDKARTAALQRKWARQDAKRGDTGTSASLEAVAALERLAAAKQAARD